MDVQELHIKLETKDLARALSLANSIVEKRNVTPILNNVKIAVEEGKFFITATDMELSAKQEVNANIITPGGVTVMSSTFTDIVRKITDASVTLKYSASTAQLEILSHNCEVALATLPVSDFPSMDQFEAKHNITVSAKMLVQLIDYTKFAISTEETRYNLNGVFLHSTDRNGERILAAAATDAHRLSAVYSKAKIGPEFGILLPRKTVMELGKILSSFDESDVEIAIGHNRILFACRGIKLISKLIDASFPDYKPFIPLDNNNILEISAKLLANVIDRVATITIEKFPSVKFSINEDQITINAHGEARGLANEVVPIDGKEVIYRGNNFEMCYNPRYLLDVLGAIGDKKLKILFADSFAPTLIKLLDDESLADFIVMPVKR